MLAHPCFHKAAGHWFEYLHLAVAPRCNMKCNYCDRISDCVHENRPGISSKVLTPRQAWDRVRREVRHNPRLNVVGIAGPGEPLANKDTFKVLDWIHSEFPDLIKCVSTNGLLLEDTIDNLLKVGVKALSVTINGIDTQIVGRIVGWISYKEHIYKREEAASLLIEKQFIGIKAAVERGFAVKINSVMIPGVNDHHLVDVALSARKIGVRLMNIVPFVPNAEFVLFPAPLELELNWVKKDISGIITLTPNCRKCSHNVAG